VTETIGVTSDVHSVIVQVADELNSTHSEAVRYIVQEDHGMTPDLPNSPYISTSVGVSEQVHSLLHELKDRNDFDAVEDVFRVNLGHSARGYTDEQPV
jgi:hypothetical protein